MGEGDVERGQNKKRSQEDIENEPRGLIMPAMKRKEEIKRQ